MASTSSQADIARRMWESENYIQDVGTIQQVYGIDYYEQEDALLSRAWIYDPEYLQYVKISAVALLKMIMHTRIKHLQEVRGYLEGKVWNNTIIITDTFNEPYEGSVNMGAYIYNYFLAQKMNKQRRHRVGWYRSQPNYGCWLPEVVYEEQLERQEHRSFILIVIMIDPIKTVTAGKVCLSAFRLYPRGYTPRRDQPIPQPYLPEEMKLEFLKNCKHYYPLEVTYFKTELDKYLLKILWKEYWIQSLGSSEYLKKMEMMNQKIIDLSKSLEQNDNLMGQININDGPDYREKVFDENLRKAANEASQLVSEAFVDTVKDDNKIKLFNDIIPKEQ